MDKNITRQ